LRRNSRLFLKKINKLKQLKEQNSRLRDESVNNVILESLEVVKLKKERDTISRRVQHLKERINYMKNQMKNEREEIKKIRKNNKTKMKILQIAKVESKNKLQKLELDYPPLLDKYSKDSVAIFKKLAQHRKYLITELLSFFPLNPISETECAIVNIILPNVYSAWPELPVEVLGAAVGYLVHMQNIMTVYLDISLPYQMEFFGSRSKIWRGGSELQKKYLLFNNNEEEIRIGLEMLNWNVVHLAISQGVMVNAENHEHTLPNLLAATRSPLLGSYGSQSESLLPEEGNVPQIGRRKRTVSISSLTMPFLGNSTLSSSLPLNQLATVAEEKQLNKKDEEDFVLIDAIQVPTPSQTEEDIHNYEKAMFMS